MGGNFATANELATRNAGRVPLWYDQSAYTDIPTGSAGTAIGDATRCALSLDMRANAHRRQADLTIPTFDAAGTYVVTINGTTHTSATPASKNAAIVALATAINAGAQAAVVTASALDVDGAVTTTAAVTLRIVGDVEADFSFNFTASGGTTVLAAVADPSIGTLEIWGCWAGTAATGSTAPSLRWKLINDQTYTLNEKGWMDRIDCAGMERVYLRVTSLDTTGDGSMVTYSVDALAGPCQAE
jgi:hypothetical protein